MLHLKHLLTEALIALEYLDAFLRQVLVPPFEAVNRHGVAGQRDLARAGFGFAAGAAPWEAGGQVARRAGGIRKIQVIDGFFSVIQQRALDQVHAQDLDEEVDITLRCAGAQRDVMQTLNAISHKAPNAIAQIKYSAENCRCERRGCQTPRSLSVG